MDTHDLQHFVDVYEARAEVTTRTRAMEKILRTRLFERRDDRYVATAGAEKLYVFAKSIFGAEDAHQASASR
jgi:DNA-binding transcriptional LysR family regulator